jgi:tRNA-splicing ligase RtcB
VETAHLRRIDDTIWEIPVTYRKSMRVPARILGTQELVLGMDDAVAEQIVNVASLPGIVEYAYCMPDGHSGYGFPIGGAAAFDPEVGVISPGGIGFDINCGMRLIRTGLTWDEVRPRIEDIVDLLFDRVPAGVGRHGSLAVSEDEFRVLATQGARWCLARGLATEEDLERTEEGGCMAGADAATVSDDAVTRGYRQIGTLGSGNHYLEIQVARPGDVVDAPAAAAMGIDLPDQVLVMLHSGSRGFGHQVASDYLKRFLSVQAGYGIVVRDRELACAPLASPEGKAYFAAMRCAANVAFVNRQVILHHIRGVFSEVFGRDPGDLGLRQIYDVTHNTAKLERHQVGGRVRELLVHRKGATRALPPGDPELPAAYREHGQPVIIGGSMETGSYLLVGTAGSAATFHTTAHGSGRTMGRNEAKRRYRGRDLRAKMASRGIYVRSVSDAGLAEEAGAAYKDIDEVVRATERAGISRPVVRLTPVGNVKG